MQYWRELTEAEQKVALEEAEKFFSNYTTPSKIQQNLAAREFERLYQLAERQLLAFDLPSQFSERARQGLLASLIVCAADEEKFGESNPDQHVAEFHELLIRDN